MNTTEAVYGFAAWLTTHPEAITIGQSHDAAIVAQRCQEWCTANDLPDVTEEFPRNIVHPVPK